MIHRRLLYRAKSSGMAEKRQKTWTSCQFGRNFHSRWPKMDNESTTNSTIRLATVEGSQSTNPSFSSDSSSLDITIGEPVARHQKHGAAMILSVEVLARHEPFSDLSPSLPTESPGRQNHCYGSTWEYIRCLRYLQVSDHLALSGASDGSSCR